MMKLEDYAKKKRQIKSLQEEIKAFEEHEKKEMISQGMATMVTKFGTFTVKKAYERHGLDTKRFKEDHEDLFNEYQKTTKVAESISFKLKEN